MPVSTVCGKIVNIKRRNPQQLNSVIPPIYRKGYLIMKKALLQNLQQSLVPVYLFACYMVTV
jgi:hypothetical protein